MLLSCLQQSNFIFISSIFKLHKRSHEKLASDGRLRKHVGEMETGLQCLQMTKMSERIAASYTQE